MTDRCTTIPITTDGEPGVVVVHGNGDLSDEHRAAFTAIAEAAIRHHRTQPRCPEPTPEELAYVATWASSARAAVAGHVLVDWDGEPDSRAWTDPAELRPLTPEEAVQAGFRGNRPCPPTCPCWQPGPVCAEWMGLDGDPDYEDDGYCPRCGWARHLHPPVTTEETP